MLKKPPATFFPDLPPNTHPVYLDLGVRRDRGSPSSRWLHRNFNETVAAVPYCTPPGAYEENFTYRLCAHLSSGFHAFSARTLRHVECRRAQITWDSNS